MRKSMVMEMFFIRLARWRVLRMVVRLNLKEKKARERMAGWSWGVRNREIKVQMHKSRSKRSIFLRDLPRTHFQSWRKRSEAFM